MADNDLDIADISDKSDEELSVLLNKIEPTAIKMPNGTTIKFPVRRLVLSEIVEATELLRKFSQAFAVNADMETALGQIIQDNSADIFKLLAKVCGTNERVMHALPGAVFVEIVGHFVEINRDFFDRIKAMRSRLMPATPASASDGAELRNG